MKLRPFLIGAAAVAALASTAAKAATITTLPFWDNSTVISAWGGDAARIFGEVLIAPVSSLDSFTFEVNDNGVAANYVAQVYAWSGSTTSGGPVGPALYTSPASVLAGVDGFQAVTTNTGGVAVTAGKEYDSLLFDGSNDGVASEFGLIPPVESHPGVVGDVGFTFNIGGPSNVNGTFFDFGSLAYSATFSGGVPEPATWAMMLVGFAGLGGALRSSRRKQAAVAA